MDINLTPEQERIIQDELRSGEFRSAEDVIASALAALKRNRTLSVATGHHGHHEAVREMLEFVEKNRTTLQGTSVKQLIHEGHRL